MNSAITSAGMTFSSGGRASPACSAHRPAAWSSTTPPTTSALRGREGVVAKRSAWGMRQWHAKSTAKQCLGEKSHEKSKGRGFKNGSAQPSKTR